MTLVSLALSNNIVLSGTPPNIYVGRILNRNASSIIRLTDDANGRFTISGGHLFTGTRSTDYQVASAHMIELTESDAFGNTLSTALKIHVAPGFGMAVPAQGNVHAPQPLAPKGLSQIFAEVISKAADAFIADEIGKMVSAGVVIPKTCIALFSKEHAEATLPKNVHILDVGLRQATHICLPDERYDYQQLYPDAEVLGVFIKLGD